MLTIAVAWPKGIVQAPSRMDTWRYWLQDFSTLILAIIFVAKTIIFNFLLWLKKGKNPDPGVIIAQFDPPADHSPADCGYINQEATYKNHFFTATLLHLAINAWIKIEHKFKNYLIVKHHKYILTKNTNETNKKDISEQDQALYDQLLRDSDTVLINKE